MSNTAVEQVKQQAMTKGKVVSLEERIHESIAQLKAALPNAMSAERIGRIALTCLRINPKLYAVAGANPNSFLAALFQSAQLGLEPNTIGEAWLIPYGNEVKFQIGAYGWAKLFYNHDSSVSITMETVKERDLFECDLGSQYVKHVPPTFTERGKSIGYYAIVRLAGGGKIIKLMSVAEAREWAIRFSKCWSKKNGDFLPGTPWKDHFDAMGMVTVLKQALKLVPKSAEMIKKAFAMDETVKTSVEEDMSTVPNEIDYSTQGESVETEAAEAPAEAPAQEPPTNGGGEAEKRMQILSLRVSTAANRKDIAKIYDEAKLDVENGVLTEAHLTALLAAMEARYVELTKPKEK